MEGIDKEGPIGEGRRANKGGGEGFSGRKEGPIKEGSRANQGGEGDKLICPYPLHWPFSPA